MPFISDGQIQALQRYTAGVQNKMALAKAKAEEKVGEVKDVAEAVGAAAVVGFIRGKVEARGNAFVIPNTTIDGELVLGTLLLGASLMDMFGKYDQDVQNAGMGVMAHYLGQVARNWGKSGEFGMVAGVGAEPDPLARALSAIV